MIPVYQTQFGSPKGNCFMACIASILEIPLRECPDLSADSVTDWNETTDKWLAARGLKRIEHEADDAPPEGYALANGPSTRGLLHSCVAWNGKIIHDPHPSGEGLLAIEWYTTIETDNGREQ